MLTRIAAATSTALTCCAFLFATVSPAQDAVPLKVVVTTPKQIFVLGEPIPLDVSVTNVAQEAIKAYDIIDHSHGSCPEFGIYIAQEDEAFRSYTPGDCIQADISPRRVFDLKPNGTLDYQLRVLYANAPPSNLAISEPGTYAIAVKHPQVERVKSSVVKIRVTEPRGVDAKIWNAVQSRAFLYFLHWGAVAKEDAAIPLRAAELLKSHAESSYHDDLRWALKEYYQRHKDELSDYEAQLIREVARIAVPRPDPTVLDDDARLDQVITYHFPNQTPLNNVLRKATRQSGVSLAVDPKLQKRTMASARVTQPLRTFMHGLANSGAHWIRDGDGYLLAALNAPREEEK